jgi:hypothetical protein
MKLKTSNKLVGNTIYEWLAGLVSINYVAEPAFDEDCPDYTHFFVICPTCHDIRMQFYHFPNGLVTIGDNARFYDFEPPSDFNYTNVAPTPVCCYCNNKVDLPDRRRYRGRDIDNSIAGLHNYCRIRYSHNENLTIADAWGAPGVTIAFSENVPLTFPTLYYGGNVPVAPKLATECIHHNLKNNYDGRYQEFVKIGKATYMKHWLGQFFIDMLLFQVGQGIEQTLDLSYYTLECEHDHRNDLLCCQVNKADPSDYTGFAVLPTIVEEKSPA